MKYPKSELDVLEVYVSEHGQKHGNVSWQMAKHAVESLREWYEHCIERDKRRPSFQRACRLGDG